MERQFKLLNDKCDSGTQNYLNFEPNLATFHIFLFFYLKNQVSKATILQKSIDIILENQQKKEKQDEELAALKREVRALEIMRTNYEQLVKAHQARVPLGDADTAYNDIAGAHIPANLKFEVFRQLMDSLFESFNEKVSMQQFQELSAGVFAWLEEQCKPQLLQELLHSILQVSDVIVFIF